VIANTVRDAKLTAVDNNPLALLATTENVPNATTILCGDPKQLQGEYDFIFSNPPIHEGKELSFIIVNDLVQSLPKLLKKNGAAYIVAQITVPIARMAKQADLECIEIAASRSFRVSKINARYS
jgi:16S rRNA (guanine1207-N2)-methyltransferase